MRCEEEGLSCVGAVVVMQTFFVGTPAGRRIGLTTIAVASRASSTIVVAGSLACWLPPSSVPCGCCGGAGAASALGASIALWRCARGGVAGLPGAASAIASTILSRWLFRGIPVAIYVARMPRRCSPRAIPLMPPSTTYPQNYLFFFSFP